MKALSYFEKIYLYQGKVDFRKQLDGLGSIVVSEMKRDFKEKSLFIFCSKDRRKIKMIYFDSSGFALWYKRLDREKFRIKFLPSGDKILTYTELEMFLKGFDILKQKPHKNSEKTRFI